MIPGITLLFSALLGIETTMPVVQRGIARQMLAISIHLGFASSPVPCLVRIPERYCEETFEDRLVVQPLESSQDHTGDITQRDSSELKAAPRFDFAACIHNLRRIDIRLSSMQRHCPSRDKTCSHGTCGKLTLVAYWQIMWARSTRWRCGDKLASASIQCEAGTD